MVESGFEICLLIQRSDSINRGMESIKLPSINCNWLQALTDDTGILQHAKSSIADRREGYTTDLFFNGDSFHSHSIVEGGLEVIS